MAMCFGPLPVGCSSDTFVTIKEIPFQAGSRRRQTTPVMPLTKSFAILTPFVRHILTAKHYSKLTDYLNQGVRRRVNLVKPGTAWPAGTAAHQDLIRASHRLRQAELSGADWLHAPQGAHDALRWQQPNSRGGWERASS